jgi:hypothetical protein
MNISSREAHLVTAKTCGCEEKVKIAYAFSESSHSLCLDKKDILESEIQACERLSLYAKSEIESTVVGKEIAELRMALDLLT